MKRYRFKTKEEFIRDDGWDFDSEVPYIWNSCGEMNHYMGKEITNPDVLALCSSGDSFSMDDWAFRSSDYVEVEKFQVGKWYTNPLYPDRHAYFRVSDALNHGDFHTIHFDAVADKHWNIMNVDPYDYSQTNSDFEEKMQLVNHMSLIQQEAKRRYPIGTKIIPLRDDGAHGYKTIRKQDTSLYKINREYIWANDGDGSLFSKDKWAETIDEYAKIPVESYSTEYQIADELTKYAKSTYSRRIQDMDEHMSKLFSQHPAHESSKQIEPVYSTTIRLKSKKQIKTLKL